MPGRWMQVVIIVFWLAMTGWLVRRELLPRFGYGELTFRSLTVDRPVEETSRWRLSFDSKPLGSVETAVRPGGDGSVVWFNRADLVLELKDARGEKNDARVTLRSEFRVDPDGRLSGFQIHGGVPNTPVHGSVEGNVADETLSVRVQLGSLPGREFVAPIKAELLMNDRLAPLDRFPPRWLSVGRQWTTRTIDPLSIVKAAGGFFGGGDPDIEVVRHRVAGIETIIWNNRPLRCFQIESRYPSSTARTWVRMHDNRVVRHEQVLLGGVKVTLELEQPNE